MGVADETWGVGGARVDRRPDGRVPAGEEAERGRGPLTHLRHSGGTLANVRQTLGRPPRHFIIPQSTTAA